jgi:hypothetical protein
MSAHMRSQDPSFTGQMVGVKRKDSADYDVEYFATAASNVANHVKHFPKEWILANYRGVTQEALDYMRPLIEGQPVIIYKNGIPAFLKPFYLP